MNVCFVVPTLAAGGAERVISTLANYWSEQGWQVTILVLDKSIYPPAYSLLPSVRFESIEIFDKPKNYLRKLMVTLRQVYLLRKAIVTIDPQVVISFVDITSLLTRLATLFSGKKLIVSERSNPKMSLVNPLLKRINYQWTFQQADGVVVQTERVKLHLPLSMRNKAVVIPNPVTAPQCRKGEIQRRHKRITSIGRLEYPKAYDTLIRAFADVHSRHPDWKLRIVGQGSLEEELKVLGANLGVEAYIEWYGNTTQVYEVLSEADIFVLSSRYEGFPNTLCEAMASGLAVIATDCDFGPREVIEDEKNGLLTPVDDKEALAQCIDRLIKDNDLRETLGQRAKSITSTYALSSVSQRWEEVLRAVIR